MRKEKKLNPVKKLAKKTALRTAYQAQAHAKQAGQEIRGGASGEGPSDNYAQQKVEDKANVYRFALLSILVPSTNTSECSVYPLFSSFFTY